MPAPVASDWSGRRVGLAPTGKRRLFTAHTQSRSPKKIEFNTSGHQLDSSRTGIASVNGVTTPKLENWARAAGDVLNIDGGSGRYKFVNPKTNHGFSVDMSDWNTPKRGDF